MKHFVPIAAVVVLAAGPFAAFAPAAAAAPPAGACQQADPATSPIVDMPWEQNVLDLRRVWEQNSGAGVTVAVVDSGVDADHPQLRSPGKVLPGRDFYLTGTLPGNFDCASHGTAVASIIAGSPVSGVGFAGVAPAAHILPVRVIDKSVSDSGEPAPIDPLVVAAGIGYAADQGAKIINLSISGYGDIGVIRNAIEYAQSKDALVVAAVGNRQQNQDRAQSYPAAYPGVLGVGATDSQGERDEDSQIGDYVDVVAPGKSVVGASRVAGHNYWSGTSFAAAFVSGTAALVRSAWPRLDAEQVAERITATASIAPGGTGSQEYGHGLVNPYRAVTEVLSGAPQAMPPVPTPRIDPSAARESLRAATTTHEAIVGAAFAGLLVLLAAIVAWTRRGVRRSHWRPARATLPPIAAQHDEPPEQIFLFPVPAAEREEQR